MATAQQPTAPKPLPFYAQFSAGAIAGVSELLCLYPLDVVKTRMQLQTASGPGVQYNNMIDCFAKIIKNEGFGRLYRGLTAPMAMEAPKRAVKFAANDFWGVQFRKLTGNSKQTQSLALVTGCAAGATESFVVTPFELVKIRLQDRASAALYSGPLDVVKKIVAGHGVLGMYKGMESTFWRHVSWNGGYFGCIFQVKAQLPTPTSKTQELTNNFISGTIGGAVGTAINTPFDVVKSRIQGSVPVPGQVPKYNWAFPSLVTIAREEGFGALYKGFAPKVLRLAPGGGVLLLVVEVVLNQWRNFLGPPYQ